MLETAYTIPTPDNIPHTAQQRREIIPLDGIIADTDSQHLEEPGRDEDPHAATEHEENGVIKMAHDSGICPSLQYYVSRDKRHQWETREGETLETRPFDGWDS